MCMCICVCICMCAKLCFIIFVPRASPSFYHGQGLKYTISISYGYLLIIYYIYDVLMQAINTHTHTVIHLHTALIMPQYLYMHNTCSYPLWKQGSQLHTRARTVIPIYTRYACVPPPANLEHFLFVRWK